MQLKASVVSRVKPVLDRYRDLRGREEAAAITLYGLYGLYGLFALFAFTVLAIAVVGFISADDHNVAERIVEGIGLTGSAAKIVTDAVSTAQESRATATVVGIVGLVWVGSSFAVTVAPRTTTPGASSNGSHAPGWSASAGCSAPACC